MRASLQFVLSSVVLPALVGGCAQLAQQTQPVPAQFQANPSDPPDLATAKADERAAIAALRAGNRPEAMRLAERASIELRAARRSEAPQPNADQLQALRKLDADGDAGIVGRDANDWTHSPDNLALAREQIGEYYENGGVVQRDYAAAASWYQKALNTPGAYNVTQKAAYRLGMLYEHGGPNLPRDHRKAEQIFAANHLQTPEARAAEEARLESEIAGANALVELGLRNYHPPQPGTATQSEDPSWSSCHLGPLSNHPGWAGYAGCSPW